MAKKIPVFTVQVGFSLKDLETAAQAIFETSNVASEYYDADLKNSGVNPSKLVKEMAKDPGFLKLVEKSVCDNAADIYELIQDTYNDSTISIKVLDDAYDKVSKYYEEVTVKEEEKEEALRKAHEVKYAIALLKEQGYGIEDPHDTTPQR